MTEQQVTIAHQLYQARNLCRDLFADQFKQRCEEYQQYIRAAMVKHQCTELGALLKICKRLDEIGAGTMNSMWAMAAAVEMLEPSDRGDQ